jgi:hypothetical protein
MKNRIKPENDPASPWQAGLQLAIQDGKRQLKAPGGRFRPENDKSA